MKVKTSITLSEDLIKTLEKEAMRGESRSELIERLLKEIFVLRQRQQREARDIELINRHASKLNQEALDVLDYQVES